jgi:hypothetical protein
MDEIGFAGAGFEPAARPLRVPKNPKIKVVKALKIRVSIGPTAI